MLWVVLQTHWATGRICPGCVRPVAQCVCKTTHNTLADNQSTQQFADGALRITRQTKGRKGKGVSLIQGFEPGVDLKSVAKQLKAACGVGGAVKNGVIEIQSDDRAKLQSHLEKLGFAAKISGG